MKGDGNVMKRWGRIVSICALMLLVAGAIGFTNPALADGGSPFNPGDKRIDPLTGDRVAVYCNDASVDVWGIDYNLQGSYLTTFSMDELTSGKSVVHKTDTGSVTLALDSKPVTHMGFSDQNATTAVEVVDTGTQYHITWVSQAFGADGSQPFVKTFSCTYLPMASH